MIGACCICQAWQRLGADNKATGINARNGSQQRKGAGRNDSFDMIRSNIAIFRRHGSALFVAILCHTTAFKSRPKFTRRCRLGWLPRKTSSNYTDRGRSTRVQKFTWNADGTPHFGAPVPLNTTSD
jgi:hypothetical protein